MSRSMLKAETMVIQAATMGDLPVVLLKLAGLARKFQGQNQYVAQFVEMEKCLELKYVTMAIALTTKDASLIDLDRLQDGIDLEEVQQLLMYEMNNVETDMLQSMSSVTMETQAMATDDRQLELLKLDGPA